MAAPEPEERRALRLERGEDGIAVIVIDCPGQRQNVLDAGLINEASRLLDELDHDQGVTGVVFASGKPGSFVAGADIGMISACESADEASALARTGQRIFQRISDFRVPVVAAIDGVCLGGGLELALACHARVAADGAAVRLGLPEVQLGLLPGSGGTQRLPRLIGVPAALDLMLTGRQVPARKAGRLGLVDEVVPASILRQVAVEHLRALARDRAGARRRPRPAWRRAVDWALQGNALGRRLVLLQARRGVAAKTHGNYPAPPRIIDCVETGVSRGFEAGLAAETRAFGELAMTPECRELMGIYFATTAMKKDTGLTDPAVEPWPVRRVAVLGAGLMGAGIGFVTADKARLPVRLKDVAAEGLSKGLARIERSVAARRRRGSLTDYEAMLDRRRVTPTLDYSGFAGVDLVIEAVFEDVELKHGMLADVEAHCPEHTVFASNTSSIPITDIAAGARRPANVVGMHYFSPVERMPLLEVIAHEGTAPAVIATAVAVGRQQGKTPIVVNDGAGFYVNRMLAPYLNEALYLLGEGVPIQRIDAALVRFGFPVGPFKLLDEVGIDIVAHVAPILHTAFGERMKPVPAARRMLDDGRAGRKSGRGFYRYGRWRPGKRVDRAVYNLLGVNPDNRMPSGEIIDRCVLPMLNEAVRCLDDGVLRSARDGDIAAVYGIGFPPFRGGPFRYIDRRGPGVVLARLQEFERSAGSRFTPAERLAATAHEGERFHAP